MPIVKGHPPKHSSGGRGVCGWFGGDCGGEVSLSVGR